MKAVTSVGAPERAPVTRAGWLRAVWDIRYLPLLTAAGTYGLIVLGGVVRASEAGLGCPDWPLCHGQVIPPLERDVLIEYSHRLAAMTVGFMVLGTVVLAWRSFRGRPAVLIPASLAFVLMIVQALLGGATVNRELQPELVTAHLAVAMALLSALLVTAVAVLDDGRAAPAAVSPGLPPLALLAALAAFALILSGSYVTGSGAGLAFDDWPLFNGRLVPEGGRLAHIHFLHRLMAAAVGLFILYVAGRAWRQHRRLTPLTLAAGAAVVLYGAQVLVGAANIWSRLEPVLVVAHLGLAAALLGSLVLLTVFAYRAARPPAAGEA